MREVVISTRFAHPRVGGVEAVVRAHGAELVARGLGVTVHANRVDQGTIQWQGQYDVSRDWSAFEDLGMAVVPQAWNPSSLTRARIRLLRGLPGPGTPSRALLAASRDAGAALARQWRGFDVVHRFGGNLYCLAAVTAARRLGIPSVVTPLAHPGQHDDDPLSVKAYLEADLVVATTHADAQVYTRLGVAAGKVRICPLPTAAREQVTLPDAVLRQLPGMVILMLGARRPGKGVELLMAASDRLLDEHPDVRVAFVGPGAALPAAPPHVLDIGEVDDATRDAWLRRADVVCMPSSEESWGLAVSEAWSCGKPVVTSDIPVFRERLAHVEAGIAVPREPSTLAAALSDLLHDDARRQRYGAAGLRYWVEHLSPAASTNWHLERYEELLEGKGNGSAS